MNQERNDKNKIYSLHKPEVSCISKDKEHKKYKFGNKASIAQTLISDIIVGALNVYNEYDDKTLEAVFSKVELLWGCVLKMLTVIRVIAEKRKLEAQKS